MVYELAKRSHDGVLVRLVWDAPRGEIRVRYRDDRSGERFVAIVPRERALDAFHHPNAYRSAACFGTVV